LNEIGGELISDPTVRKLTFTEAHIADAVKKRAKVVAGGQRAAA
jgi:hypothetical protein